VGVSAHVRGLETFLRDIVLSVVNLLSTAICIWLSARQVPEELTRRTLFPLLARPVRRFDVLLGKFAAVWLLSCFALLVLAAAAWANLVLFHATIGPIFWQYLYLRALSFGPIAAMTIALSLVFSPAASVIFAGLLTLFATTFARSLYDTIQDGGPAAQAVLKPVYFLLPHLDLFDLSQRAAYNYPPIALWVLGVLLLYAGAYVIVFLGLGNLRFRRMAV
ncbi:MAG TPA: ABC transporter permease subunit, partial [Armatimonadota bacterium]|nr:ABC transporter permease subunit [Armatimonadota bacterium]